jgi:glycogen synthase
VKILIAVHLFPPSVGGLESCTLDLALAFSKLGHHVRVLTQTPSDDPDDNHGLDVVRCPSNIALFRAVRWCDLFFQSNISLQITWPLLFARRPWVVCTHTWLRKPDGSTNLYCHLKRLALRFATNIYISKAIRDHVGYRGFIIPNPYNSEAFHLISGIARARSLVFLGRLVSDKGCDLLVQCLSALRDSGFMIPLTVIGSGPEEESLRRLVVAKGLDDLVCFVGILKGEALARELNRHQVLVVPSRWDEPFGMVALEGIACGCFIVGSAGGGLTDAIGDCGVTFRNGDVEDLCRAIREAFERIETGRCDDAIVANHLERHRAEVVASRYLKIFEHACLHGVSGKETVAHLNAK